MDVLSGHKAYDTNSYEDKQDPSPRKPVMSKSVWAYKRTSVDSKKESGAIAARQGCQTIGPPPKKPTTGAGSNFDDDNSPKKSPRGSQP